MKRDFDNKKKGFWGIESLGFCRVVVIVVRGGGWVVTLGDGGLGLGLLDWRPVITFSRGIR